MNTGLKRLYRNKVRELRQLAAMVVCLSCATIPMSAQAQISKEDLLGLGLLLMLEGQRSAEPAPNNARDQGAGSDTVAQPKAARSELVAEAQGKLNELGYDAGSVDGQSGPRTRAAVAAFQRDHGLQPTGEISTGLMDQLAQVTTGDSVARVAEGEADPQGTGANKPLSVPQAEATADLLIKMAVMSDQAYFRSVADAAGINFIRATGTDEQCRVLYEAQRQDEFARRDVIAQATMMFNQVMDSLPERPIQAQIPVEATYFLGEYDFERKGYPIRATSGSRYILLPGTVPILNKKLPTFCVVPWGYNFEFADHESEYETRFENLLAEHDGLPGIDFLPLDEETAKVFADRSKTILLKAQLVVEPRTQGRGPLVGKYVALDAYVSDGGQFLYSWNLADAQPEAEAGDTPPLSAELLAQIIVPVIEPFLDDPQIDNASVQYFRRFTSEIDKGNDPPGSPLPIDVIRGKLPEVIAEVNRPALRAHLREVTQTLPVTVEITNRSAIYYEEGTGLRFNALQSDLPVGPISEPDNELVLSDRGLQLSTQLIPLAGWGAYVQSGFRPSVLAISHPRVAIEFDRVVTLKPVPAPIEEAAARGLVGNMGAMLRDNVMLHWQIDIEEVRLADDMVILSARLRNLTYRWESDGTILASFDAAEFPTMTAFNQLAEDALPPLASADRVAAPPDGSRWDAEMSDLLQLRFAGETIDDTFMERMMIARFVYEARTQYQPPIWGNFFRSFDAPLPVEERIARLKEFRVWSEARAAALPGRLSIVLPLSDQTGGKFAPFERTGPHPSDISCRSVMDIDPDAAEEGIIVQSRACRYLAQAWQTPDRMLKGNLRIDCLADEYCSGLGGARRELGLDDRERDDVILLDRLPVLSDADRQLTRKLAIQLEVEPTGASQEVQRRETNFEIAQRAVADFIAQYNGVAPSSAPNGDAAGMAASGFTVFTARSVSAQLVDMETGEILAALPLAEPPPPPDDLLVLPETSVEGRDILGIRLGMSFDEADRIIRTHMKVSQVLLADRSKQLSAATGDIVPYTSGRIYASGDGHELIAILDEPPAAPGKVLGVWRLLRLPKGSLDPGGVKAALVERYGAPSSVQEVQLPYMEKGIALLWAKVEHPRCGPIEKSSQPDIWLDEQGSADWLPPFMRQPSYPLLAGALGFSNVVGTENPASDFCPAILGAQFASHGEQGGEPAGDEIITWLSDNRAYSAFYYESRKAPDQAGAGSDATGSGSGVEIKF